MNQQSTIDEVEYRPDHSAISTAQGEEEHHCIVPARAGVPEGASWKCSDCGQTWDMTLCGGFESFLDWRKDSATLFERFLLPGDVSPHLRQPEPLSH